MARPCKSIITISKNLSNEEKKIRLENEENLKGAATKLTPPSGLNARQKKIFKFIVSELKASGILGNLDIYILNTCCIAIDRLQTIEESINKDSEKMRDKTLLSWKDKYTSDLFRCTNELSLSPQSRSKLSNINFQANQVKVDPLLNVLAGKK